MAKLTSQAVFIFWVFLTLLLFSPNINAQVTCQPNGTILTVSNTNDEGPGSLREAIICANAIPGANSIHFNILGAAPHVIFVGSTSGQPLPNLTDVGTVIDGTTQTGFSGNPRIILDGFQTAWTGPFNALFILGDYCEVYGLTIRNFPDDAIDVLDANHVRIGDVGKGNVIYNNGIEQDIFPGFPGNWNGCGIVLRNNSDTCTVQGNIIGTNYNQTLDGGNEFCGIIVYNTCVNVLLGGTRPGEENIVVNNAEGIRIMQSYNISIRENVLSCNDTAGIYLVNNGNFMKSPPVIEVAQLDYIFGTAPTGDVVEVFFVDDNTCQGVPCQGSLHLGTALVQNGSWYLPGTAYQNIGLQAGMKITATATNSAGATSSFAPCRTLINANTCADADGVIWVNNIHDEGIGSLRSAIDCANVSIGPNIIKFNIPDSVLDRRILVGEMTGQELPALTDANTVIDATTQFGFGIPNFDPKVILDGSKGNWNKPINAIWVRADSCEIYGLEIINFPDDGIDVAAASFAIIGAPNKGNAIYNNGYETDFFPGQPNSGPWNGCGIVLRIGASFCKVQGNYIGTNITQDSTSGNEYCGILVRNNSNSNLIGGDGVGEQNIIAHHEVGVSIGSSSQFCRIQQNSFYCNDLGIEINDNSNQFPQAPTIDSVSVNVLLGKGNPGELIELFLSDSTGCEGVACQGKIFLGTTTVDTDSTWSRSAPFANGTSVSSGDLVTATATDTLNNTSEFFDCAAVVENCNPIVINFSEVQNLTCGNESGGFTIIPSGGTAPYEFYFENGLSNNAIQANLGAGMYVVTVADSNGCTGTDSIQIIDIPFQTLSVAQVTNEQCGMGNGSVNIIITQGALPFTFDIGNGSQTSSTFENLNAGGYNITLTDVNGCESVVQATVGNTPSPIMFVSSLTNENCDQADGSFSVFAIGGAEPFTYDIGNGAVNSSTFSNLSSGVYSVTATDAVGCTVTAEAVISDVSAPEGFVDNLVAATCNQNNGSFTVVAFGGTPFYTFDIGNGATSNNTFTNLAAGNYEVTITDIPGCTAVVPVSIIGSDSPTFEVVNIAPENCGQVDGAFEINASGGTAPYLYNIGSGASSISTYFNLNSADYNIIITDANGCSSSQVFFLPENSIETEIGTIINAECGATNGSISISATGGTAPYSFDFGGGANNNGLFENLAGGTYNITITDAVGCSAIEMVAVMSTPAPTISIANVVNATCGSSDGSFEVSASDGTAPYTYDIGFGATTSPIFNNINTGTYEVVVTDDSGCTATETLTITNTNAPSISIINVVNETCSFGNGSFEISVTDGIAPFTYDIGFGSIASPIFNNINAGTYEVVVTDNVGCTATETVNVTNTPAPSASIENVVNETCGQGNGSFEVVATGGTAPYTYDTGSGIMSSPFYNNINTGTYEVTITDNNGCIATETVTITNGAAPTISIENIVNETCGQSNGSFEVVATGGAAPYTYDIGFGETTSPIFNNLITGTYEVVVTDEVGCSATESVAIINAATPTFSIINIMNENCGQTDGSFELSATGGLTPYTYNIGAGPSNNTIYNNLNAAGYNIIITDANGCSASQIFTLDENILEVSFTNVEGGNCGAMDGQFTVEVISGTAPFSFDIGNGTTNNNTFTNLNSGSYQVTVSDANGCEVNETVAIEGSSAPFLEIGDVINSSCGNSNGIISLIASGGVSPYTYDFGNGPTSSNVATNLVAGEYNVTVTDANNCSDEMTISLINVGSSPEAEYTFNNNLLTVGFSNISVGATSFLWDFGDGNSSTQQNPDYTFAENGTYEVCLTATNNCGSETFCQTITVFQIQEVVFDLGEIIGMVGDTVYLEVTVEEFTDIVAFQKSIHIMDGSIGKFIGVENISLPNLTASDFTITDETVTVDWTSNIAAGETVTDGTIIYELAIELFFKTDCTDFIIDGSPLAIGATQMVNGNNINIGVEVNNGEVCVNGILGSTIDIAGLIAKENGQTVANVEVSCTNASNPDYLTNATGAYEFLDLPEGGNFVVTPYKNDGAGNGITVLDLSKIRQHIIGSNLLDSPYKIIAADANNSGAVTILDLVSIRKVLIGTENSFPNNTPSWRFVPTAYVFPDPTNPLGANFPEEITLNNLTADSLNEDFVAIKVGDVNLSAVPSFTNDPQNGLTLVLDYQEVTNDGRLVVDFLAKDFDDIQAWQMDFDFDATQMVFEKMVSGELTNFKEENIGKSFLENGRIPMVWADAQGLEMMDDTKLFSLVFKVKPDFEVGKETFQIREDRMAQAAFRNDKALDVKLLLQESKVEQVEDEKMWVSLNAPNPFRSWTKINFYLPTAEKVDFSIYDQRGQFIFQVEKNYESGANEIVVDENMLEGAGWYFYKIKTSKDLHSGKMLFFK